MDMSPLQDINTVTLLLMLSVNDPARALKYVFQPNDNPIQLYILTKLIGNVAITLLQFKVCIKRHRDEQIELINFKKSRDQKPCL